MQFPTFTFTLFLMAALFVWWGLCRPSTSARTRTAVLLGLSLVFYAWADWRWVGILVGVGLLAAWGSRWVQAAGPVDAWSSAHRWRLTAVIVALAGHLVVWKYSLWLVSERNDLAQLWGASAWTLPEWAYPAGLSFFTFHALALVLSASRGKSPLPSPLQAMAHVAFFPALMAGPVLRADAIVPRLQQPFVWREVPWLEGVFRIAIGMGFKWVLASQAAAWADPVFSGMTDSNADAWWGVHAYALQIFFDFAGYSHMALGVALLLGFRLPENFTQPYGATSFQDFWRRWHRSLSFFFRDYLYIDAFGGRRHGPTVALMAAAATMLVSGLWHGASVTFLIWGAWHAGALVLERLMPGRTRWPAWLGWVVTFEGVVWGWVFFRAEDWPSACAVLAQAWQRGHTGAWTLGATGASTLAWAGAMVAALVLERHAVEAAQRYGQAWDRAETPWWQSATVALGLSVWAGLVMWGGPVGVPPFIYNGF